MFFCLLQVSAYHEKFVHRLEKSFIQPVIDWEAGLMGRLAVLIQQKLQQPYTTIPQQSDDQINANVLNETKFSMNFEKFVKFIIHELEINMQSYGSLHWWPFTRLCGLCHIKYDFIGQMESLESDVKYLASKVPEFNHIEPLFANKFNKNNGKTEETSLQYFAQLPEELVQKLYYVYQDDFQMAGYEYPRKYLDVAKSSNSRSWHWYCDIAMTFIEAVPKHGMVWGQK